MKKNIKLYNDDCIEVMKKFESECIDLTVTSPPYDNLRTYKGSLKWNENIWKSVIKELYRITKKGGVVIWVVGDATIKGSETGTSFKQALYFKEVGFNLHDTMIYKKANPIPLTHNRYEQQFEYMFVFSKGRPKTFNPIMIPCKTADKKYNIKRPQVYDKSAKRHYRDEIIKTKNEKQAFNIWEYAIGTDKKNNFLHPAPFPEKLANDHIISWSNEGDIIFDPFMGSGTTGKMAIKNNRKFIGIEKVKEYFDISKKQVKNLKKRK